MRPSGRSLDQLRDITIETGVSKYAEGSCLIKFGDTHVLCTATVEDKVPGWMRNSGKGWITAEYGMLPRATDSRMQREATRGGQSGRTQEIQRLIGRSIRAVTDLKAMGEMQMRLDCDVIQADGGTRTASITGAYIAAHIAFQGVRRLGMIKEIPFTHAVAAISCGLYKGTPVLDLDYAEDSNAGADANFVLAGNGGLVEVQATAEDVPFERDAFDQMLDLARKGCDELFAKQRAALGL
ncbi:ribonuclease PH [Thalassospira mesophila]|uniref:Ribonuclease PH n=1 Tax=Thalassospira mesophila TaxID=1293891 RepID=A0A1Y2L3Q0_9PROT|nr:ribonuclease PH [Thalassospira mesophila]OSQ40432.1 ribonuclease PH [Thalassospira mesophila]